jgi:hypothetical protein
MPVSEGERPRPTRAAEARDVPVVARRAAAGFFIAAGLVAVYVLLLGNPVMRSDETWFLWVAHRVTHGDVLYRDVYYVSSPLAAWLGSLVVYVGGTSLLAVRFLSVSIFVGSAVLAWVVARRAHLGVLGRVLLLVALLVYGSPIAHFASVYSALAILCALGSLWAGLGWLDTCETSGPSRTRWLWVGGLAVGLTVASKPNIGMLVAAAWVATILLARHRARASLGEVGRIVIATCAVAGAVLLPVVVTGGFAGFLSDVVLEKGAYVRVMSGNLLPGFDQGFSILPGNARAGTVQTTRILSPVPELGTRYFDTFRFVLLVALVTLVWAVVRSRGQSRTPVFVCVAYAVAALLAAFPEIGPQHATEIMPLLLTSTAASIGYTRHQGVRSRESRTGHRALIVLIAVWLGFGVIAVTSRSLDGLNGDIGRPSTLPALGSSPVLAADVRGTVRDTQRLRRLTHGSVFIIRADASYYYLAGGLRNPTPFDFPVLSDFGSTGEDGVIDRIEAHRIQFVCVPASDGQPPLSGPDFRPLALEHAVRHRMDRVAHLSTCDLYTSRRTSRPALVTALGSARMHHFRHTVAHLRHARET